MGSLCHMYHFCFKLQRTLFQDILLLGEIFYIFSLGSLPIWPTCEQINEIPEIFKRIYYPSTRCILDCTELYCQRASSLSTQSLLYSHYESHVTYKGLFGVSPSGSITFVSQLYDGSISDKEIVRKSGILEK